MRRTRLWSINRVSASNRSVPGSVQTLSTMLSGTGPAKTPKRLNKVCSVSPSRCRLQSTVAGMVCCRAGRSREAPVADPRRASNRARSIGGGNVRTCPAASSMARGSASTIWQMASTSSAYCVSSKPGSMLAVHCCRTVTSSAAHKHQGELDDGLRARLLLAAGIVEWPRDPSIARRHWAGAIDACRDLGHDRYLSYSMALAAVTHVGEAEGTTRRSPCARRPSILPVQRANCC